MSISGSDFAVTLAINGAVGLASTLAFAFFRARPWARKFYCEYGGGEGWQGGGVGVPNGGAAGLASGVEAAGGGATGRSVRTKVHTSGNGLAAAPPT